MRRGELLLGLLCCLLATMAAAQKDAYEQRRGEARAAQTAGRLAEAEQNYLAALEEAQAFGATDACLVNALTDLGQFYDGRRRYSDAEAYFRRALSAAEKLVQNSSDPAFEPVKTVLLAVVVDRLASFYAAQKRHAEAEANYLREIALWQKAAREEREPKRTKPISRRQSDDASQMALVGMLAVGSREERLARTWDNLAEVYLAQGRNHDAENTYQRALEVREQYEAPEDPRVTGSLSRLARLYARDRNFARAEPLYNRLLKLKQAAYGAEHPQIAAALNDLAVLYSGQGKYAEAEGYLQRCLAMYESTRGKESAEVAITLENYAKLLRRMERKDEAEKLEARAKAIRNKNTLTAPSN